MATLDQYDDEVHKFIPLVYCGIIGHSSRYKGSENLDRVRADVLNRCRLSLSHRMRLNDNDECRYIGCSSS